jgi:O-antigen ligase
VWPDLGGRAPLAEGYRILGLLVPAAPLSVAPYSSLETLLTVIPAIALFCAIARLRAYRPSWLTLALLAGTFAGILLGALQVVSTDPTNSPWYLYSQASWGLATGFFANANHMATLLVISLPFLAALLAAARGGTVQRYSAAVALVAGAALVILVGLALNRSLAGYGLALPVVAASLLIVVKASRRTRRLAMAGAAALVVAAAVALAFSPVGTKTLDASTSVTSRAEILETTSEAIGDFLPFGSGLGTFRAVYKLYEDPAQVTPLVMPHAHNDYAELALELGLPGVILIAIFLLWWAVTSARAWRMADATPYARAATIATAAILIHSIVDYPLRTAALSACFAMCLALIVDRRIRSGGDASELWPTRHVVLR